jgi:hypothetical protein
MELSVLGRALRQQWFRFAFRGFHYYGFECCYTFCHHGKYQYKPVWGGYVIFFDNSRVQVSDFFFQKSATGPGLWILEISNNRSGPGF